MLDIKFIRDNPEVVRKAIRDKQMHAEEQSLTSLLLVDEEYRLLRQDVEKQQAIRNSKSKEIGLLKRKGESAEALMQEMASLSEQLKKLEEKNKSLSSSLNERLLEIPNLPHESVPYGKNEHDNQVVKDWGEKPSFAFKAKPHWELAEARAWIDFKRGVKTTGAGFPVFMGQGARLVRALKSYFLDSLGQAGYKEVVPPLMVNPESALATGQLPDKEGQMYEVSDGFYLVPTSELVLAGLHRDEILDEADLPINYTAYSACFRREAGSYGKDVRGINRVHQFDKVEMVSLCKPDQSYQVFEEMTRTSEKILESLGLAYRRLLMCSGDMGFTQAKKYDLEVWSAGQEKWLEVSSISNITDFQARRLKTRFRPGGKEGKGKPDLVHTLNGSAMGFPRIIAALLENYQQADGSVALPEVLHPYMGKETLD